MAPLKREYLSATQGGLDSEVYNGFDEWIAGFTEGRVQREVVAVSQPPLPSIIQWWQGYLLYGVRHHAKPPLSLGYAKGMADE